MIRACKRAGERVINPNSNPVKMNVREDDVNWDALYLDLKSKQSNFQTTNESLETLWNLHKRNVLILNPKYQRGNVWSLDRRRKLIKTALFSNKFFPAVVTSTNPGGGTRNVVDGRSRLTTFSWFLNNEITVHGRYFDDWDPKLKELILRTPISVVTHFNLTLDEELTLFSNLQQGMALTSGEKLNGRLDAATSMVKEWVKLYEPLFPRRTAAQKSRSDTLRTAMSGVIMIVEDGKAVLTNDAQMAWLDSMQPEDFPDSFKSQMVILFDRMLALRNVDVTFYDKTLPPVLIIFLMYRLSTQKGWAIKNEKLMARAKEISKKSPDLLRTSSRAFTYLQKEW